MSTFIAASQIVGGQALKIATSKKFLGVAANALTGIGAAAHVGQGFFGKRAFDQEADAIAEEGMLAQAEADEEARRVSKENKAKHARIAMKYTTSGVTMAGSPLLSIKAQADEDEGFVKSIRQRGVAKARLADKRSKIARNKGRAQLVGGLGQSIGTLLR